MTFLFVLLRRFTPCPRAPLPSERYLVRLEDGKQHAFESNANVKLSVVVPAYNESKRIGKMLDETVAYLKHRQQVQKAFTYEIIVVDDGSKDGTPEVVGKYAKKHGIHDLFLLKLEKNRGKGGAVTQVSLSHWQFALPTISETVRRLMEVNAIE